MLEKYKPRRNTELHREKKKDDFRIKLSDTPCKAPCNSVVKFFLFFPLCFLASAAFLSAQTAAELEAVLETPAITCTQAAWFVLASIGSDASAVNAPANAQAAFEQAAAQGWLKNTQPDDRITLGQLSFLIMRAFEMKGGLMYLLLPGPRYAYRSMLSRSFIQGEADPAMTVSGERFLDILGKVLSAAGGES